MTQAQQSEAQRLAAICETKGMFPVADELNRMHARILELEQSKCLHQIAEPEAPHAARDLGLAALEQYLKECEENQIVADVGGAFAYAWQRAAAPQAVQPAVPVLFVSREQLESHTDHLASEAGRYLPARKTAVGKFTMPLYAHPAEGVPAQNVQITLTGYQLLAALRLANPSLDFAPMELLTDIVLSETPLVDFDGAQLHEGPIAWVDGVNESAIALEAEPENDLRAANQPAAQGLAHKEPSFYAAFGECGTALPQYSAHTEDGVIYNVLAVARNEGFKGSGLDRLMELGWVVRPVFREAALAAQAKQGGAA